MLHSENVIYCPLWKHDRSCLCHHWHFPYQSSNWGKLRQQSIGSRNKMGYQMNTRIRLSIISEEGKKIDLPHYCEQKLPIEHACLCKLDYAWAVCKSLAHSHCNRDQASSPHQATMPLSLPSLLSLLWLASLKGKHLLCCRKHLLIGVNYNFLWWKIENK